MLGARLSLVVLPGAERAQLRFAPAADRPGGSLELDAAVRHPHAGIFTHPRAAVREVVRAVVVLPKPFRVDPLRAPLPRCEVLVAAATVRGNLPVCAAADVTRIGVVLAPDRRAVLALTNLHLALQPRGPVSVGRVLLVCPTAGQAPARSAQPGEPVYRVPTTAAGTHVELAHFGVAALLPVSDAPVP